MSRGDSNELAINNSRMFSVVLAAFTAALIFLFGTFYHSVSAQQEEGSFPRKITSSTVDFFTTATIYGGVTADNGDTFGESFDVGDVVQIPVVIEPESLEVGISAKIYVLATADGGNSFIQLTSGGIIGWDGDLERLAELTQIVLEEQNRLDIVGSFDSGFTLTTDEIGDYSVYIAYSTEPGAFTYTAEPIQLQVKQTTTPPPPPLTTSVEISGPTTVQVGHSIELIANVTSTSTDPLLVTSTWTSSNTGVVSVDAFLETASVTGIAQGTATITATSDQDPRASASVDIEVTAVEGQPLQGRVVRITQNKPTSPNPLQLAEVRVFEVGSGTNVALGGTASQSSQLGDFGPNLAIDDNLENFQHTLEGQGQYWQVDLLSSTVIADVEIHARDGCCNQQRTADIQLQIFSDAAATQLVYEEQILGILTNESRRITINPTDPPPPIAVEISGPATVQTGATIFLVAEVLNGTTVPPDVQWSSSNSAVASVDSLMLSISDDTHSFGEVTGVSPGTVTITAKSVEDPTSSGTFEVTVQPAPVPPIVVEISGPTTVPVGTTIVLEAEVINGTTVPSDVRWGTSNAPLASVVSIGVDTLSYGQVTGISPGTVTIGARSIEDPTAIAYFEVEVTEAPPLQGRVVRITQNKPASPNPLQLAEVRVFEVGSGTNVALGGTASQSSQLGDFGPNLAIDDNLENFQHTLEGQGQYWQVDLLSSTVIADVEIHARDGCCNQQRTADIQLQIFSDAAATQLVYEEQILGILTDGSLSATINTEPPPPQFIHQWLFDGTGAAGTSLWDWAGDANGQLVEVGDNIGWVGAGQVTLSGGASTESDYIALPGNLLSGLTDASIELWATPHSVKNGGMIFNFGDDQLTNSLLMSWSEQADPSSDLVLWRNTSFDAAIGTMAPYTLNQEHHIVMTIDQGGGAGGATLVSWYKDGQLQGTAETSARLSDFVHPNMFLGRSDNSSDETAHASYNELRIYDGALSATKIAENFYTGPVDDSSDIPYHTVHISEPPWGPSILENKDEWITAYVKNGTDYVKKSDFPGELVLWHSSNEEVATVIPWFSNSSIGNDARIKGVSPGTAIISAISSYNNSEYDSYLITVDARNRISISGTANISVSVGEEIRLEAAASHGSWDPNSFAWSSNNREVATVVPDGVDSTHSFAKLTGKSPGKTRIVVYDRFGGNITTALLEVTVLAVEPQISAVLWNPNINDYYLFKGNQYFRQGHDDRVKDGYPRTNSNQWPGWPAAWGTKGVDAAVFYPGNEKYYLFKGDQYLRQNHGELPDQGYPRKISENWAGYPVEWGAEGVDAVVYNPDTRKYTLFNGDEYVTHSHNKKADHDPRKISDWPGWPGAWGSGDVGAAVFHLIDHKYYLFKGNEYVSVTYPDAETSDIRDISDLWLGFQDKVPSWQKGVELSPNFYTDFDNLQHSSTDGEIEYTYSSYVTGITYSGINHVQGLAWAGTRQKSKVWALSHDTRWPIGEHLLVLCNDPSVYDDYDDSGKIDCWNHLLGTEEHPGGGMQIMGGVLIGGDTNSGDNDHPAALYDIRDITKAPVHLPCTFPTAAGGTGAMAWHAQLEVHVVVTGSGGSTKLYVSNGKPLDSGDCKFSRIYNPDPGEPDDKKKLEPGVSGEGFGQLFYDRQNSALVLIGGYRDDDPAESELISYSKFNIEKRSDGEWWCVGCEKSSIVEKTLVYPGIPDWGPGYSGPSLRFGATARMYKDGFDVVVGAKPLAASPTDPDYSIHVFSPYPQRLGADQTGGFHKVRIHQVEAIDISDGWPDSEDEIFLRVGDDVRIPQGYDDSYDIGAGEIWQIGKIVSSDTTIKIRLYDLDETSSDDLIGSFTIDLHNKSVGNHTKTLKGDGGEYVVYYEVLAP